MHSSYWHHPSQTAATLRPHCKVWTRNGSLSCSMCRNSRTACWLETTSRAPKTDMDSNCSNDLKPANIGLHTVWRRAQDRADWMNFISTATLHYGHATDDDAPIGACYWWWWWWYDTYLCNITFAQSAVAPSLVQIQNCNKCWVN